ncbi:uncharacterized protein LOC110039115 [Phalaenopsis equestris]|uniref:uncharacterized protein LOC110039115 n=1 Tax=Phalaenopsis equestris TaxID=78828 RepID=UPI0009E559D2|nr:uncharacterized protein LOC110039115 [Phalaenopsis equestris]
MGLCCYASVLGLNEMAEEVIGRQCPVLQEEEHPEAQEEHFLSAMEQSSLMDKEGIMVSISRFCTWWSLLQESNCFWSLAISVCTIGWTKATLDALLLMTGCLALLSEHLTQSLGCMCFIVYGWLQL